jgi:hypothetical protein
MTRRVVVHTADYGRDTGKQFVLTELPAEQAEWWAIRAGRALAVAGVELPEDWENAGMAQIAVLGFAAIAHLPEHTLKALLDEMFTCVQFKPANPKVPPQPLGEGVNCQIEEVKTRWQLRQQLYYLHTGFSPAVDTQDTEQPS